MYYYTNCNFIKIFMSAIRITMDSQLEEILLSLQKNNFPLLKYPEIIRVAVGEYYTKREKEKRKEWEESLPIIELNEEESAELSKAKASGSLGPMTREKFWELVHDES